MKIFNFIIILFLLILNFSESHAQLTHTLDGGFRAGNDGISTTGSNYDTYSRDQWQSPQGAVFNNDGTKLFGVNHSPAADACIVVTNLSIPFDISSQSNLVDAIDPVEELGIDSSAEGSKCKDIDFNKDGTKMYIVVHNGKVYQFSLGAPYDFSNITYDTGSGEDFGDGGDIEFNNDGTKLYFLNGLKNAATITEFSLSTPYDITTKTEVTSQTLPINLSAVDPAVGFQFNSNGTAMFVLLNNAASGENDDTVFQYRLSVAFDTSSATLVGSREISGLEVDGVDVSAAGNIATGILFSNDGFKFYVTEDNSDNIFQISLPCPFGFVSCQADTASNIGSQIELAKKNIHYNTSTIFKRFDWIKRNRNKSDLNSFNINLNSHNPVLASLTNKLQASLNSNSSKIKSSTWSFWTHGDVSLGNQDATLTQKPKHIKTSGLTFGADKKFGNNKFGGIAIRYANNANDIKNSSQNTEMESLTLNLYGTLPKDEATYTNFLIGYSLLRIDQKFVGKISGERNGHQVFTSANFRSNNSVGKFNITPSGKFSYGVTHLSEFTDFVSAVTTGENDLHESITFETGDLAVGFLFDVDEIIVPQGILRQYGGFEFVSDITPANVVTYNNNESSTNIESYSKSNFRSNIGTELVYPSGLTFSLNYERFQHLSNSGKTDSLMFKFGHVNEDDYQFALNYNPLQNNQMEINYVKDVNGFNVKVGSNYSMVRQISDYGANIEVSRTF